MPEAVLALAEAMSRRGAGEAVARAFQEDAEVRRLHWGERRGQLAEHFVGIEAIAGWLARSPDGVRFHPLGPVTVDGPALRLRYRITVADFQNEGSWRVELGEDGRIRLLEHQPDDLPPLPRSVQP